MGWNIKWILNVCIFKLAVFRAGAKLLEYLWFNYDYIKLIFDRYMCGVKPGLQLIAVARTSWEHSALEERVSLYPSQRHTVGSPMSCLATLDSRAAKTPFHALELVQAVEDQLLSGKCTPKAIGSGSRGRG